MPSEPPTGRSGHGSGHGSGRVSELVAELAAGGELIDEGAFSIDANQARTKLRRYGLSDPRVYACLLVEVGVLCDAPRIRVELQPFTLTLRFAFGGACFAPAELEQLFSALFTDVDQTVDTTERRRRRALQLLAVSINAAFSLGAASVSISSHDASGVGGHVGLFSSDDGESIRVEPFDANVGTAGRCIVAIHFARSVFAFRPRRPEQRLLQERCRFSDHAISLAGKRLSHGPRAAFEYEGRVPLSEPIELLDDAGEVIGLATAMPADIGAARLELLINGWLSERITLDDYDAGFVACVEVDLTRDLSQRRALRNSEFEAVMASVRRAHDQLRERERERSPAPVAAPSPSALAVVPRRRFDLMSIQAGHLALLGVFGSLGACGLVTAGVVYPSVVGPIAGLAVVAALVLAATRSTGS